MSVTTLEREIVARAKLVSGDNSLTAKRLMDWCTGSKDSPPITAQEGETLIFVPDLFIWAAFAAKKKK